MERLRRINIILSTIGLLVFSSLLAYVQFAPDDFDRRTKDFAITKVETKLDETLLAAAKSETADKLQAFAGRISETLESRVAGLRDDLANGKDQIIADMLAAACALDCERREQAAIAVRAGFKGAIARYGFGIDRIQNMVVDEYKGTMNELRMDVSIFAAANTGAMLLALLIALFKGRATRHLLPITYALFGATLVATAWYIFGQDWVMTIVFNDYWGTGYGVFLAVLSAFMIDILANEARITTEIFNGIGAIFDAVPLSPC